MITKKISIATLIVCMMITCSLTMGAGNFPQPVICDRACWSARAPQCAISQETALTRAVIHHTAFPDDYNVTSIDESKARVRAIQNYHMDVNGWCDVGYHFLTDKLGNNFEGREGSITSLPRGAHDAVNSQSFGYNMMGYYHTPYNHTPTCEGRSSIYDVIAWKMPAGWSPYGVGRYSNLKNIPWLAGHRDVAATACPGDLLYAYITTDYYGGEARNEINARITTGSGGPVCGPTPTPTPTPIPGTDVIVDNDSGSPVYTETGGWSTSGSTGYNGGTYRYAKAGDPNTATWTADLLETGSYEVKVIYVSGTNRSNAVQYDINTAGGVQSVSINQQQNSLVWVSLGVFNFAAGANTITLNGAASAQISGTDVVIADAVRFTQTAAPTPTPEPTPTPLPSGDMFVQDISMAKFKAGTNWYAKATIWIKDTNGQDVSGATVSGNWSGSVSGTSSGTTGADGKVILQSPNKKNGGTFTFCVSDVVKTGVTYNSSLNIEECDSIIAP